MFGLFIILCEIDYVYKKIQFKISVKTKGEIKFI